MPELPEVETMCRGIMSIVGSRIGNLQRPRTPFQPIKIAPRITDFKRRVVGRSIIGVRRLGKRVVVALDKHDWAQGETDAGDCILFEPRMSGLILLADPPDWAHVRLVFELSGRRGGQLIFWSQRGLGVVRLVSPRLLHRDYGPKRLGPDALDISLEMLRERLASSRRAVKVALMDQKVLAGIGNLYASEILHRVGIHPEMACNILRPGQWKKLHAAIREVLQEAIRHQGSTLSDGTYRISRDQPGSHQLRHRVYQRAGQPCLECGKTQIVRIVQAQRSSFFCPRCQKAPGNR